MGNIINGVEWLDDLTFKTPEGKIYRMVAEDVNSKVSCCNHCCLDIPDDFNICGLDTDPDFKGLTCWGQSEINSQSQTLYYFIEIDEDDV